MDRADISQMAKRRLAQLIEHPPENVRDYSIRMTSGTTGGDPFLTIWRGKDASGLQSGASRFLIAYGPRAMRLSNMLFFRNDPANAGSLAFAADVADVEPGEAHLFDEFAPDVLYAFPSFAARFAAIASKATGESVRTIGLSGESLSGAMEESFARKFPNARIVMTWGAAETGVVTKLPCTHLAKNAYHPRDEVTVAIDSPDEDGIGLLLISKTLEGAERIERYKTGDMARLRRELCPCGEPVTFELLGRAGYDYIKLAGAILRQEEFDRVARLCAGLFDDYRVEASESLQDGSPKGSIVLRVHRAASPITDTLRDTIARTFSANLFLTPTSTLQKLADDGVFAPLVVEASAEAFSQGRKDVKFTLKK